jgi:hypothetical protein
MFSFKSKSIIGQVFVTVCFVLALGVQKSGYAKTPGDSNPADPIHMGNPASSGMSKTTLASIKIDTTRQSYGEAAELSIFIQNDVGIGGFQLEVDFPKDDLSFIGAERGEALSDSTNGEYDWEFFTFNLSSYNDSLYRCTLNGAYDLPSDSHQGIPLAIHPGYISLVELRFLIGSTNFPPGTLLPVVFEWEGTVVNDSLTDDWDCTENTFWDPYWNTVYASQNPVQFNPDLCPVSGGVTLSPTFEFLDGGVFASYDSTQTGDVNLNAIPYEIADWVCFQNFLVHGDSLLINPEQQAHNSDVNCDLVPWTISDLLYLCRVILHDADEIPCKSQDFASSEKILHKGSTSDELTLLSASAHPGDTVSVPVWLSNSIIADGVTFNISFDSASLSVVGVDTFQTRIEGWQNIVPVINPGEMFFYGYPDWWYSHPIPFMQPGEGVLLRINFKIADAVSPGISLPITFETDSGLGHYNAYTDTTGLTFVQLYTTPGWIYTDVISGDANSDGILDVGDLVYLLNYLYRSSMPPSPVSLGDFNQDSEVNVSDVVALINYLFHS